jgi:hypothetical protein
MAWNWILGLGSIVDGRLSDGWTALQLLYSGLIILGVIFALLHRYGSGWSVGDDGLIGWGEKTAVLMALLI